MPPTSKTANTANARAALARKHAQRKRHYVKPSFTLDPTKKAKPLSPAQRAALALRNQPGTGGRPPGPLTHTVALTKATAADYVRLRASGVPAIEAVLAFAKPGAKAKRNRWLLEARRWDNDPLVSDAWNAFNGQTWQEMEKDERLVLAMDHHLAQCAYVLYTADVANAIDLKKIAYARECIQARLDADRTGSDSSRFEALMRDLMSGKSEQPTWQPDVFVPEEGLSAESRSDEGESRGGTPPAGASKPH